MVLKVVVKKGKNRYIIFESEDDYKFVESLEKGLSDFIVKNLQKEDDEYYENDESIFVGVLLLGDYLKTLSSTKNVNVFVKDEEDFYKKFPAFLNRDFGKTGKSRISEPEVGDGAKPDVPTTDRENEQEIFKKFQATTCNESLQSPSPSFTGFNIKASVMKIVTSEGRESPEFVSRKLEMAPNRLFQQLTDKTNEKNKQTNKQNKKKSKKKKKKETTCTCTFISI